MIHTLNLTTNEMKRNLDAVKREIQRLLNEPATDENLAATESMMILEYLIQETLEEARFKP